jgi:hypothetical protein
MDSKGHEFHPRNKRCTASLQIRAISGISGKGLIIPGFP